MSRWFVLGNGPSLNDTPLDKLIGENTIGMNRIHLIYDKVKWRPTIYMKLDYNPYLKDEWQYNVKLHLDMGIKCYLWEALKDGLPEEHPNHDILPSGVGDHPNAVWVKTCKCKDYSWENTKRAKSWHLPEICTAFSTISVSMQIAILEGATEIYLLGCDLGMTSGKTHFVEDYLPEESHHREYTEWMNGNFIQSHILARDSSPIPIYNSTVGGDLEVHPRRDINEVLMLP